MKYKFSYVVFFFLLSFITPNCWASSQIQVVFLNPDHENGEFFGPLTRFMQSAAINLNIELEVLFADFNRFKMQENATLLLQRKALPDYLILVNEWNTAPPIMQQADKLGVKTLLFNEGLEENDKQLFLTGPNPLKNWIGEVIPNDFQAGWLLAKTLIDKAQSKQLYDEDGQIHIIGITGTDGTRSSVLRAKGLRAAIKGYDNTILHQVTQGNLKMDRAEEITSGLLRRYPETTVIWTASDLMALGATKGIIAANKTPNQDVITGGVDWAPFVFDLIKRKTIATSIGGHIFDGGWAMVMIYDHVNGRLQNHQSEKTTFSAADIENNEQLKALLNEDSWQSINFMDFSKSQASGIKSYHFGADLLLNTEQKTKEISAEDR